MIRGRRRTIALAALALAAPLPAFALSGGAETTASGPATLSVSSSLRSCGVLDTQVVCQLAVSIEPLDNATSYAASVTRSDGSVIDAGAVSAGGNTLFVPYAGAGTYTVRVTAYGVPDRERGDRKVVAIDVSRTEPARADGGNRRVEAERRTAQTETSARSASTQRAPELFGGADEVEVAPACEPTDPQPADPSTETDPTGPTGRTGATGAESAASEQPVAVDQRGAELDQRAGSAQASGC